jgi:hypothetical protein
MRQSYFIGRRGPIGVGGPVIGERALPERLEAD